MLRSTTQFTHVTGDGASRTVTLDQPALEGSTLILAVGGGAIVTGRLEDSGGDLFTRRDSGYPGGFQDVSIHDIVVPEGGTEAVYVGLGGPDQVSGVIYEITELGAFIDSARTGNGGTAIATTSDHQVPAGDITIPADTDAVVVNLSVLGVTAGQHDYANVQNRWRQMEPSGVIHAEGGNQPGAGTEFIWGSGIADAPTGTHTVTSMFYGANGPQAYAVAAAYENLGDPVNNNTIPVVVENRRPGARRAAWFVDGIASGWTGAIAGYTDQRSYLPGETVEFKVDSLEGAFQVELFRLGHYGLEQMGARHVTTIPGAPVAQDTPTVDATLGHTVCAWATTATWDIPDDACSGFYWFIVRRDDDPTDLSTGHFVIRDTTVTGKAVVVVPDCTHQAYNVWGATTDHGPRSAGGEWTGRSVYQIGSDLGTPDFSHRSYAVSWDRPMASGITQPNTYIFDADYSIWHFLEAQGFDLTYISDTDLEGDAALLEDASLVVPIGHHEYTSIDMWDAYKNAIDAGVNVLWHSGNTALWRVRFADSGRTMICYKDNASIDVEPGFTGDGLDPVVYTGTWRDERVMNPLRRPEQNLTGQMFVANAPLAKNLEVPFASKGLPIWRGSADVQALTAGQVYTTPSTVYGDEGDFVDSRFPLQPNLVQLCPTVVDIASGANLNGTVYATPYNDATIGFTLYRAESGALVFNTGAWRGFEGVSRWRRNAYNTLVDPDVNWQNMVLALMTDLGAPPTTVKPLMPTDDALSEPEPVAATRDEIAELYGLELPPPPAPVVVSAIVGAVEEDRFVVTANVENATAARLAVDASPSMVSPVFGEEVTPANGYVRLESPTGLTADSEYRWAVELDGAVNMAIVGTVRTLPGSGAVSFSFAASAVAKNSSNVVVYNSVRTRTSGGRSATFFAHLGDMHEGPAAETLQGNLDAFEGVLAQSNQAALYRDIPLVYLPSDLDFGGNNSYAGDGNAAHFQDAYRMVFPHYPLSDSDAVYHSFAVGRILFICTDMRSHRSDPSAADNSSKTTLGTTQKAWLKTQLSDEGYPVKIWFGDSGWHDTTNTSGDSWAGYSTERDELGDYIVDNDVNVIYVHGDYQTLAADDGTNNPYGFPVVSVGPLDQVSTVGSATWSEGSSPNPPAEAQQYGWFDVADDGSTITVSFQGYDQAGSPHVSLETVFNLNGETPFIGWGIPA